MRFFALRVGKDDIHCINFPYMASVLAKLRNKRKGYCTATTIAVVSLCIALVSLAISIFA